MRDAILIIVLALNGLSLSSFGQTGISFRGEFINKYNSVGRKTGKWIYFVDNDTSKFVQLIAIYNDGRRVGKWIFYANGIKNLVKKYMVYNLDGSINIYSINNTASVYLAADTSKIIFYNLGFKRNIRAICEKNKVNNSFDCIIFNRNHVKMNRTKLMDFNGVVDTIGYWSLEFFSPDEAVPSDVP